MLLVQNAKVAAPAGLLEADVLVGEEGRIERVGKRLSPPSVDERVDARGRWLLPGALDTHVHFREPGGTHKENMATGSAAALAGGVTTVLEMPNTSPATCTPEAYQVKLGLAANGMRCDWGLYYGATSTNAQEAARSGAPGLKAYMGQSTGDLLVEDSASLLEHLARFPGVVAVHAEDNALIQHFTPKHPPVPESHAKIRAPLCEQLAVARVRALAQASGARVHVVHVTLSESLDMLARAKHEGFRVSAEVTPHHLFLHEGDVARLGNYGKMNPPLRPKSEVAGLWSRLHLIDTVGSDHAPHTRQEKDQDYSKAPSGVPGVETLLPLLLDAVLSRRLSLADAVRLTSGGPARVFSLAGKGAIAAGYDGDLALFDPHGSRKVTSDSLFTKCKWSPFEGLELKGSIESVYLRGRLAYDGQAVLAQPGWGKPVALDQ
jgi:dihydroorotase